VTTNKKQSAADIEALRKGTGMTRAQLQRRLKQLLNEGKIRKIGEGVKGDPFRYFQDSSRS
jgi:DNA-binding Lrp family transcriptional regulator